LQLKMLVHFMAILVYFTAIWYMLLSFGNFNGYLVYFSLFWNNLSTLLYVFTPCCLPTYLLANLHCCWAKPFYCT
jgi:hypothetical protein